MKWFVSHNNALVFPIDTSVPSKQVEESNIDTLFTVQTKSTCSEPAPGDGHSRSDDLNANVRGFEQATGRELGPGDAVQIDAVILKSGSEVAPSGGFCAALRRSGSRDFEFLPDMGVDAVFNERDRTATAELPVARGGVDAVAILCEGLTPTLNEITVRMK